jgi:hypothetical protein
VSRVVLLDVPPVLAQEENMMEQNPAAIRRNIDINFIFLTLIYPLSYRRGLAHGVLQLSPLICGRAQVTARCYRLTDGSVLRIAARLAVAAATVKAATVKAATVKAATVKAATMETTAKMVSRETVPIEMVQPGVIMIAVPAIGEIAIPVRSPDSKIRTGSIYVITVTPREEQRDRYEAQGYF